MVWMAFVAVMMIFAVDAMAQPPQRGFGGPQFSPEQRAQQESERMTRELGLSPKQTEQIYHLQMERSKRMQESFRHRPDQGFDREAMQQKMMQERRAMAEQYKRILTPEQFAKWEQMEQRRPEMRGGQRPPRQMGSAPKMHDKGGKHDKQVAKEVKKGKKAKKDKKDKKDRK